MIPSSCIVSLKKRFTSSAESIVFICPTDGRLLNFRVKGAGSYRASANGDPTCLDLFHLPQMHAFNGMLTVIVQAGETAGNLELQVSAKGLKTARLVLPVQ